METRKALTKANLLQTVLRWALSLARWMVVMKVQKMVGLMDEKMAGYLVHLMA